MIGCPMVLAHDQILIHHRDLASVPLRMAYRGSSKTSSLVAMGQFNVYYPGPFAFYAIQFCSMVCTLDQFMIHHTDLPRPPICPSRQAIMISMPAQTGWVLLYKSSLHMRPFRYLFIFRNRRPSRSRFRLISTNATGK